jgi:hypothetical protein
VGELELPIAIVCIRPCVIIIIFFGTLKKKKKIVKEKKMILGQDTLQQMRMFFKF